MVELMRLISNTTYREGVLKMYKIFNKTYQPIRLVGRTILKRDFILVNIVTNQIKNLEDKGLLFIKKIR